MRALLLPRGVLLVALTHEAQHLGHVDGGDT